MTLRPMEITFKTGSKKIKEIENMNIVDYMEKYIIKERDWRPKYNIKKRELSILKFDQQEVIECGFSDSEDDKDDQNEDDINNLLKIMSRERTVKIDLCWGNMSENFFHDSTTNFYQNHNNEHIEYSVRRKCHRRSYNHVVFDSEFILVTTDLGNLISYDTQS